MKFVGLLLVFVCTFGGLLIAMHFDFPKFIQQKTAQGNTRHGRMAIIGSSRGQDLYNCEYSIRIPVESVKAQMEFKKNSGQTENSQPDGKPQDIYYGMGLVFPDVAISGFKVV